MDILEYETISTHENDLKIPEALRGLFLGPSRWKKNPSWFEFWSCLRINFTNFRAGKTSFILKCLQQKRFSTTYGIILFASPNFKDSFTTDDSSFREKVRQCAHPIPVKFMNHIPEINELFDILSKLPEEKKAILTILDDFNYQCFSSSVVHDIFTRLSSHSGIDIIVTGQNFFFKEKFYGHIWRVSILKI